MSTAESTQRAFALPTGTLTFTRDHTSGALAVQYDGTGAAQLDADQAAELGDWLEAEPPDVGEPDPLPGQVAPDVNELSTVAPDTGSISPELDASGHPVVPAQADAAAEQEQQ